MTENEKDDLIRIATEKPWFSSVRLKEYLSTVKTVSEGENAPTGNFERSGAQNRALHLWFRQIADACREAGIDQKMILNKTVHVEVNEYAIKSRWHALQEAMFGTKSTRELRKTGDIEKIADHLIRFFGEELGLEIPPFPHEEKNTKLTAMNNLQKEDYPEFTGAPTI